MSPATQRAQRSPKPSPQSVRAPLDITYQRERLSVVAAELPPLFRAHHAELAMDQERAPLAPYWDRYFELDLLGILQILTVRDGPLLVGYIFNLINPHLHKRTTLWSHIDMYWLDPAYRVGMIGYRMFKENERFLKTAKVKKISVAEKIHFHNDFGRQVNVLFKRLGYLPEDVIYAKWIGD